MSFPSETKLIAILLTRISEAAMNNDVEYLRALSMVLPAKSAPHKSPDRAVKYLTFGENKDRKDRINTPTYPFDSEMYSERVVNDTFYGFQTLKELNDYIRNKYPKKTDVVLLAKALQVAAPKSSDYDKTIEKIVNATLGYRLRSQSVRGGSSSTVEKKEE